MVDIMTLLGFTVVCGKGIFELAVLCLSAMDSAVFHEQLHQL